MYQWVWTSLFIVALATSTNAETYYVATDGKADGDGSKEKPWHSVEYALSKVGGGHTIIVRPGIYRGPIQIAKQYAGAKENPTVIKSEAKWEAVIIGAPYHVISNGDGCDWVVIDGFEVMGGRYHGRVAYKWELNKWYDMKIMVSKDKTMYGKMWPEGENEPSKWLTQEKLISHLDEDGVGLISYHCITYFDDVIVASNEESLVPKAVTPKGKLAISWCEIKSR